MITCDLEKHPFTLDELLKLARDEAVHVIQTDGSEFILAPSDSFEEEVERLGGSERFMRFLADRSKNRKGRSLAEIERDLKSKDE
jgi:hypothetical protein